MQKNPIQAALFSLIIPGAGQWRLGNKERAMVILPTILALGALIIWQMLPALFAPLLGIWAWQVWDAYQTARGKQLGMGTPFLLGALIAYGLSASAVEFRPKRVITGFPNIQPYLRALTEPELFDYPTNDLEGIAPIQVPCIPSLPDPGRSATVTPQVTIDKACASIGEPISIEVTGLLPNFEGELWWINPIGDAQRVLRDGEPFVFVSDANGEFSATFEVPLAMALSQQPAEGETQTHAVRVEQHEEYGSLQPTETLDLVLDKIGETIALAFIATVMGTLFAVPISFLAARNLMGGNRVTLGIYYVVRTVLNVVRSIETLMWAIIFAVWVGLGPFGGTLALFLHTVAALGKLYSEAIESVDQGPIDALRASGAGAPQVVVYAVLPQILPTFTSFTLYRWDINVRMSTVIGLVSDAGLGFLVIQWIRLNRFRSMATALIAIIIVVSLLDVTSSYLRKRIIEGSPKVKRPTTGRRLAQMAGVLVFVLAFGWSWQVARIEPAELIRGAPGGLRLMRSFAVPNLISRPTEDRSVTLSLPVPCGSGDVGTESLEGMRVALSAECGNVGDPLTITGSNLPPNTDVSVRWTFADGAFLRVRSNCCLTDSDGNLTLETNIHPLLEVDPDGGQPLPGGVQITFKEVVGGPQISDALKTVVELSIVTLLMALMATTLGSLLAIPLSFFAARNIMGESAFGKTVYNGFRTAFNLFRSIEPMILVLICAAWVGAGPFAGVLALTLNNIPNLGKLFSETIEEIDNRPVDALTATGANRIQTLVYAIVPQLVPKFLAFIIYQWDINIRMSTVIGFVGGGGIGQQFRLWVGLNQYSSAGTATWAIVIMVWTMDYLSSKGRERLV